MDEDCLSVEANEISVPNYPALCKVCHAMECSQSQYFRMLCSNTVLGHVW
jgi:hypothetical protein